MATIFATKLAIFAMELKETAMMIIGTKDFCSNRTKFAVKLRHALQEMINAKAGETQLKTAEDLLYELYISITSDFGKEAIRDS